MNNIFFTSDQHFGHDNIIKYCNRTFKTTNEMEDVLVKNWNSVVEKSDFVYVLGDFCWKKSECDRIKRRLNGNKLFFRGNHDNYPDNWLVMQTHEVKRPHRIWLSHYPHLEWPASYHGSWHLHGHCHGNLPENPNSFIYDVGVDSNNFTPVSMNQIMYIMENKSFNKSKGS